MSGQFGAKPVIEIDGREVDDSLLPLVEEVVIDDHLHLPDMFELRFRDDGHDLLNRAHVEIGTRVTISATAIGDGDQDPLIVGEVTALEADFDRSGSHTVIRGYDLSHRLSRGRHTRTFNGVTDADIARQLATDAGLDVGTIEAGGPTYEHVSQANSTDWEFLRGRAREIGFEVAVVLGEFHWRRLTDAGDAPGESDIAPTDRLQLVVGSNVEWFRPRVTASDQVARASVRGWDPMQKAAVVGTAEAETNSTLVALSPRDLAATFGESEFVATDLPVSTQREADSAASSLAEQISSAHCEAELMAQGSPRLRSGVAVSISLAGWPYDGKYVLTSTRHTYDESGYRTRCQVSGRAERSLLGLVSMGATNGSHSAGGERIQGVVIAQVTGIDDPENMGRVKVSFPWLSDSYESWWARVVQLGAGNQRGAVWLPEVNDEVLVAFEQGDVRRPYVIGSLYNGVDKPRLGDGLLDPSSGAVRRRGFVSKAGHRLVFFDDDAQSGVATLTADGGLRISLNQTQTTIKITSSGSVEISGTSDVKISSSANVSVEAGAQLELKGNAGVTIDGGPQVKVTGGVIQLN